MKKWSGMAYSVYLVAQFDSSFCPNIFCQVMVISFGLDVALYQYLKRTKMNEKEAGDGPFKKVIVKGR